jgi:DNA-binding MarR family transcriptional regulator
MVNKKKTAQKRVGSRRPQARSFAERYADVLAPHSLVYRMKLLSQLMERRFQQMLDPFHLMPLHWAVLCCLWQASGVPTVELGRTLGQLRGTLVVVLEAMEKIGYISRRQDATDQRISRIFLTKQGHKLKFYVPRKAQELQRELFQPLSSQEIKRLSKQLNILLAKNGARGFGPNLQGSVQGSASALTPSTIATLAARSRRKSRKQASE